MYEWIAMILGFLFFAIIKKDISLMFIAFSYILPMFLLFKLNIFRINLTYNIIIFLILVSMSFILIKHFQRK